MESAQPSVGGIGGEADWIDWTSLKAEGDLGAVGPFRDEEEDAGAPDVDRGVASGRVEGTPSAKRSRGSEEPANSEMPGSGVSYETAAAEIAGRMAARSGRTRKVKGPTTRSAPMAGRLQTATLSRTPSKTTPAGISTLSRKRARW